jgi:protein phosphatase 2C
MEDLAAVSSAAAAAGLTLFVADIMEEAASASAAAFGIGAALPPPVQAGRGEEDAGGGDASACGSPCSVASECSSVATADFEGFAEVGSALVLDDLVAAAAAAVPEAASGTRVAGPGARSVFAVDYVPRWGLESICGRRPEMEDAAIVLPRFVDVPLWMVAGDAPVDGLDRASFRLPAHFFGVYDGHGGVQVIGMPRRVPHHNKRIQHRANVYHSIPTPFVLSLLMPLRRLPITAARESTPC